MSKHAFEITVSLIVLTLAACSNNSSHEAPVSEGVTVQIGPTTIPHGDAQKPADITVKNEYFAIAFAVETASPWGVARGGILDIAIIRDGKIEADFTSLVDFMPNRWSAWPSTYQQVTVEENTPNKAVIRSRRDFGEIQLDTSFEISAGSKLVEIRTTMANQGEVEVADLTSGYVAWPNGGHLFGMPGLFSKDSVPVPEQGALADWSASYDKNWALALHTDSSQLVGYMGRDRYVNHVLKPGEKREFEVSLQIEDRADLTRFVQTEIDEKKLDFGRLHGRVEDENGQHLASSAVVIRKNDKLFAWALTDKGNFNINLPVGEYQVYGTAASYSSGAATAVKLTSNSSTGLTISDLKKPGTIAFSVFDKKSGAPLDASIWVTKGDTPIIKYFGQSKFFTEINDKGKVKVLVPPGEYSFDISAAAGFTSSELSIDALVEPDTTLEISAPINVLSLPAQSNWYGADLHHHSDVLDGFTNPEFVMRAQLAAGVDIAFLSDHDSNINNPEMERLAATRNMDFIAGTELSASWGHFNAYPIDFDKTVNPNAGLLSVQEIYAEARRLGAAVIHVNHPFGNYGYFDSLKQETENKLAPGSIVPGGYDLGFDLIEITTEHVPETLERAWHLWNQGKPAFFAAGSDVHDVWSVGPQEQSGSARSYVYLEDELSVKNFVAALKAGYSYASQGPIIYPELVFGSRIKHAKDEQLNLSYQILSVTGLDSVALIEKGQEIQKLSFAKDDNNDKRVEFKVTPSENTWYSLVVADTAGNYAYSNPLWVELDATVKDNH